MFRLQRVEEALTSKIIRKY